MKDLNVVQVDWNWIKESGGASQSVLNFAETFNSTVVSLTKESGGQLIGVGTIEQIHIPYKENSLNRYAYTSSPKKLEAESLLTKADLVVVHGFYRYHFDWAVRIARTNNIPYWIIPHGSLDPYVFTYRSLPKKMWFMLNGRKSFSDAAAIIFATESEKNKSLLISPNDKSYVFHWPVASVDTTGREEVRYRIREEHNIPQDARVLLYIGRFHPMKRPIETIKAVATSGAENVYLMMMGPDSDVLTAASCNKFCIENNFEKIRFIKPEFGPEKYNFFMAADAFISLSHRENFGYTVAEALSAGIPVILSPGNDLSNDIRHLSCGWLLDEVNHENSRQALIDFASVETVRLIEMGQRGKRWAQIEFSPERFKKQLLKLARESVDKARRSL